MNRKLDTSYLFDPSVFEINLLEPHSDHHAYFNGKELVENFNDGWKIIYFDDVRDTISEFFAPDLNVDSLKDVIVPLSVELQGYGKPQYTNTSYAFDGINDEKLGGEINVKNPMSVYIKEFNYTKEVGLDRFFINFKGFESALYLYVNGVFVGYSENLYLDSEFELSSYVRNGKNRIVAIVLKYSSSTWLLDQDFVRFSGFFRDIVTYRRPKNYIYDIDAKTDYVDGKGILDLSFAFNSQNYQGFIKVEVFDEDEVLVNEKISVLKLYNGNYLHYEFDNIKSWSSEKPNLYTIRISVLDNEVVYETKIGFRNIKIEKDVLYFNNKILKLHGVNRHEWNPHSGRHVSIEDMLFDVKLFKTNNINSSRCSHYPNETMRYELCDEYGIHLIDECALESHGSFADYLGYNNDLSIPGSDALWEDLCITKLKRMYERDKNHPSILMWSLGNEAGNGQVFMSMRNYLKARNPNTVIHYEGASIDEKSEDPSDVYSRMYWPVEKIKDFIKDKNDKPFMLCEFEHAMGNSLGNFDEYMKLFDTTNVIGGFIWDYIDQGLYYGSNNRLLYGGDFGDVINDNCFNCNGIIFADRKLANRSSKLNHVKYEYQNLIFSYEDGCIKIKNNYAYIGTDNIYFEIETYFNGIKADVVKFEKTILPSEEFKYKLQFDTNVNKEIFIIIYAKFKEKTKFAEKNTIIASKQFYIKGKYTKEELNDNYFKIDDGHFYIQVKSNEISYLFRKHQSGTTLGGLTSIKFNGNEFIDGVVKPNIFRPNTDNDNGAKFNTKSLQSLGASMNLLYDPKDLEYDLNENNFFIKYRYYLDINRTNFIDVKYQIIKGRMRCKVIPYLDNLNYDIGTFELLIPLKNNNNYFTYYGRGPFENYNDRKESCFIKTYSSNSKKEFLPYIRPQESGLHLDTRYLRLNEGLIINQDDKSFGFKMINYSPFDIENANHQEDLKEAKTYLSIVMNSRGVGGDDSWGSDVHEPYRIYKDDIKEFSVYFDFGE